jgi:hypothetical protein
MEVRMPLRRAIRIAVSICLLGITGCSHVPLTTMAKLLTFDMAVADPAILRVAARMPAVLMPQPDGRC